MLHSNKHHTTFESHIVNCLNNEVSEFIKNHFIDIGFVCGCCYCVICGSSDMALCVTAVTIQLISKHGLCWDAYNPSDYEAVSIGCYR